MASPVSFMIAPWIAQPRAGATRAVATEDAMQVLGAGQARNRTAWAVERTVSFQLACQAVGVCYAVRRVLIAA